MSYRSVLGLNIKLAVSIIVGREQITKFLVKNFLDNNALHNLILTFMVPGICIKNRKKYKADRQTHEALGGNP